MAPKTDVIEQLRAHIAELEEEIGLIELQEQLAAEQLNNKRLRKALEAVIKVHGYESGIPVEALSTPASTEALDKYVAEKVKDVQLQDIEQYSLQMAGISTAAIGYWKEDDSIHPDYDTPALRDVAKLYANYESRTQQGHLAVEALENCRLLAARHRKEEWAGHIMRFCKDAGLSGSPIRNDSIKESENNKAS